MDQIYQEFKSKEEAPTDGMHLDVLAVHYKNQVLYARNKQRKDYFETLQICCQSRLHPGGKNGDYSKGAAVVKRITNNLRLFFKDQSIRSIAMCLAVPDKLQFTRQSVDETVG